jgi:hypothetical protein
MEPEQTRAWLRPLNQVITLITPSAPGRPRGCRVHVGVQGACRACSGGDRSWKCWCRCRLHSNCWRRFLRFRLLPGLVLGRPTPAGFALLDGGKFQLTTGCKLRPALPRSRCSATQTSTRGEEFLGWGANRLRAGQERAGRLHPSLNRLAAGWTASGSYRRPLPPWRFARTFLLPGSPKGVKRQAWRNGRRSLLP